MQTVTYAECHIKAPYAEWRYAECRGAILLHLPIYTAMKLEIYRASVILPSVKINFRSNFTMVKLS